MKNKNTTVHKIAHYLRKEIMYSNLKPGQHLKESEIADIFNVSRVPVREAFRILQSEGYLEVIPHRGNFVKTISSEYVIELSKVYNLLAPALLEDAIPRYKEKTYKKAKAILNKIENCKDFNKIGYLLWDFAKTIYGPTKFKFMLNVLNEIYKHNIRILNEIFEIKQHKHYDLTTHRKFLELCKKNKIEEAIIVWCEYIDKMKILIIGNDVMK